MNKWLEIVLGLILVVVAILVSFNSLGWGSWNFGTAAWEVLKGGAVWAVIGLGFLFLLLGISDLKD